MARSKPEPGKAAPSHGPETAFEVEYGPDTAGRDRPVWYILTDGEGGYWWPRERLPDGQRQGRTMDRGGVKYVRAGEPVFELASDNGGDRDVLPHTAVSVVPYDATLDPEDVETDGRRFRIDRWTDAADLARETFEIPMQSRSPVRMSPYGPPELKAEPGRRHAIANALALMDLLGTEVPNAREHLDGLCRDAQSDPVDLAGALSALVTAAKDRKLHRSDDTIRVQCEYALDAARRLMRDVVAEVVQRHDAPMPMPQ